VTSEEAIFHIRKIFDKYNEEWNSWYMIEQDRREGYHWHSFADEVEEILKAARK
jgi:heme oxygenase